MKSATEILLSVMLVAVFGYASSFVAQDRPRPVLIDEFGRIPCEDSLARLDNLMIAMANIPDSTALLEVAEVSDDPIVNLVFEAMLKDQIAGRKYDPQRFRFIRARNSGGMVRLWVIPNGAPEPEVERSDWNLVLKLGRSRRLYPNPDVIDYSSCGSRSPDRQFMELLTANPAYRGNIVLREPTQTKFRNKRSEVLSLLRSIAPKRLRFFHVKSKESDFEYWLVPPERQK